MLWEQFIGPSLKTMRTLVIRPLQGYGNSASLSYPDTWARKPDCLYLPYSWGAGQVLSMGHTRGNHTLVFLSIFLPLFPISKNK